MIQKCTIKQEKSCIKLIKTIEKCKKVVYYEAINKEETGRGTMNNEGGVDIIIECNRQII